MQKDNKLIKLNLRELQFYNRGIKSYFVNIFIFDKVLENFELFLSNKLKRIYIYFL
jgi:hypothetical protein